MPFAESLELPFRGRLKAPCTDSFQRHPPATTNVSGPMNGILPTGYSFLIKRGFEPCVS